MDIGKLVGKIPKWLREYRYPVLIVVIGLVLLTFSGKKTTQSAAESQPQTAVQATAQADLATSLAELLGQMDGVGKVKVLLTLATGETTIYHSDQDISTGDGSSTVRKDTVIITDSDKNQQALVSQVIPATYQGAVVVCQGADDAKVKWAVVEAVSKATGLGADQISVLKMK